ncbi:breast carcinoma-amplified sequence 4 [Dromiciops gliroides]|uniref:breast carcinoma-amplified sequence 4 n=1 Tax=Dromiciops gliroides TaxID=33562 RepID=UPI001CC7A770|nr:breast carcinoma-amplified sequence 4 [Dromiciops gliroides]
MHLPHLCQEEPGWRGRGARGTVGRSRLPGAFEMSVPEPGPAAAAAAAAAFMMLLVDGDGDRDRDGHGVGDREQSESQPEPLHSGAQELALSLTPEPGAEVKEVEATIEDMLLRLEEFCGLTDMIRNDTSQILDENIPLVKAKVMEMSGIYTKVDKLEAFVKMVGHHVSFLEAQVLQAEKDYGAFPHTIRKWLQSTSLPAFRNKQPTPVPQMYELPTLYRTEDYFPMDMPGTKCPTP